MFVAISKYLTSTEDLAAVRPAHLEFLHGLDSAGRLVCAGRQEPPAGGVLVIRAADLADAEATMASDPFVVEGKAQYVITQFAAASGEITD